MNSPEINDAAQEINQATLSISLDAKSPEKVRRMKKVARPVQGKSGMQVGHRNSHDVRW